MATSKLSFWGMLWAFFKSLFHVGYTTAVRADQIVDPMLGAGVLNAKAFYRTTAWEAAQETVEFKKQFSDPANQEVKAEFEALLKGLEIG